jgi:hypothetical protein
MFTSYTFTTQQIFQGISVADPHPGIQDPGWVKIKIRIRDEHPGSCFRVLGNSFGLKIVKYLIF